MTNEERTQMLKAKVAFVSNLNTAITGSVRTTENGSRRVIPQVVKLEYIIHTHITEPWVDERLVVTYTGGAVSVRNCTGTSCSGIFGEVAKLLDAGYYDEVERFKQILSSQDWVMAEYCTYEEA